MERFKEELMSSYWFRIDAIIVVVSFKLESLFCLVGEVITVVKKD